MKKSVIIYIGLIFILISCSKNKLNEVVEMCICDVTEHYIASTDEVENKTKVFTFKNSPVFELGVSKKSFATSAALYLNRNWDLESFPYIKINIQDSKSSTQTTAFEYSQAELNKLTPDYLRILDFINSFVSNIYQKNYQETKRFVDVEMDLKEFSTIIDQVRTGLEDDYINTKIVGYNKKDSIYNIYGGVWTKNETLDLFRMTLKNTNEGLMITSFEF